MRNLLNTLWVNQDDVYATLENDNVVLKKREQKEVVGRYPLQILQSIYLFTYAGASPALMGRCVELGVDLIFCSPSGKFLARTTGMSHGNVHLRRKQYRMADDEMKKLELAKWMLFGKVCNSRQILNRFKRDHGMQIDYCKFEAVIEYLRNMASEILEVNDFQQLRGLEGNAAKLYFGLFDEMILRNKESFFLHGRNRRPPTDNVNALLSYTYTLCGTSCAAALESAGLDSYVGFLHEDRPGRNSLSQDLLEELRSCMCDRFVLRIINNRIVTEKDFEKQLDGAVLIKADGRKRILHEWKKRNQTTVIHPYLNEKIEWGMVPWIQSILLAQYIRGDIEGYPMFLFK